MREPIDQSWYQKELVALCESVPSLDEPLALACSGGIDSMVLLHLTLSVYAKLGHLQNLIIIHVDHGQNPHSGEVAKGIQDYLASYIKINPRVSFLNIKLKIPTGSSEASMRTERYLAIESALTIAVPDQTSGEPKYRKHSLLLAHHSDDQLETLLFRLMRGAHPESIRGMQKTSLKGTLRLIRPLLARSRQEILAYANTHHIPFWEDPSNSNTRFARNAIRHRLIPLLEELRPRSPEKLLRFFDDLGQMQKPRNEVKHTENLRQELPLENETTDSVKMWLEAHLKENCQRTSRAHWEQLFKAIESSKREGKRRVLQFPGGASVVLYKKRLRWVPHKT